MKSCFVVLGGMRGMHVWSVELQRLSQCDVRTRWRYSASQSLHVEVH